MITPPTPSVKVGEGHWLVNEVVQRSANDATLFDEALELINNKHEELTCGRSCDHH